VETISTGQLETIFLKHKHRVKKSCDGKIKQSARTGLDGWVRSRRAGTGTTIAQASVFASYVVYFIFLLGVWCCAKCGALLCVGGRPLPCCFQCIVFVTLPVVGNFIGQWIIGIWHRHQRLDGQQHRLDLQCWAPALRGQRVQANSAQLINIGVIHLRQKSHLGRFHRVVLGQKELQGKDTSMIRRIYRSCEAHVEVSKVLFVWSGRNSGQWLLVQSLDFALNANGKSHFAVCGVV